MYRPYSSPVGASGSSDVQSTIRGLTQDFSMNFNTGNYDQVAGIFASDGLFMAPHHESTVGPKAIERKLREFGESGYQNLRLETIASRQLRGHGDGNRPLLCFRGERTRRHLR